MFHSGSTVWSSEWLVFYVGVQDQLSEQVLLVEHEHVQAGSEHGYRQVGELTSERDASRGGEDHAPVVGACGGDESERL